MSAEASRLNRAYLNEMHNARGVDGVLGRIKELWWDPFTQYVSQKGPEATLDNLDLFMSAGRTRMGDLAVEYAERTEDAGSDRHRLLVSQWLKSNTGKMFERFVGLALAHCLLEADAAFCVQPFRDRTISYAHGLRKDDFKVLFRFGDGTLYTFIDADVFAFNPTDPEVEIYMISVKSTLKDRFHNVAFWNLLRRAAISGDFPEVVPNDPELLRRLKYIAVCSDLAKEQPDFATDSGARNLLQVDASLLDGAYVTASRARGLPRDCTNSLGDLRSHAFYPYSCFFGLLTS